MAENREQAQIQSQRARRQCHFTIVGRPPSSFRGYENARIFHAIGAAPYLVMYVLPSTQSEKRVKALDVLVVRPPFLLII
ncbi:hypothetical protein J7T55_012021 [Diaporthe amygdali]|uniref:uncharacterized protein n=1 Tax=Phomopsis amygdali TaxID=1214568 RepID=UPI0022FE43F1|nr:uncharacterized protein J7T55_012021 [Diaporthe amygdali]KAJ0123556.1 hypothetical protein J7T55_012021 [Diaporthe amygdali]